MFAKGTDKHPHWDSALRRFADSVEMKIVAEAIGMNPQTLRNKLNPAQPHELTAVELLRITHATQNYTLVDGALAELGHLPSLPMDYQQEETNIPVQALKISAAAGELAGESVQLIWPEDYSHDNCDAYRRRCRYYARVYADPRRGRYHRQP
ncbi:phage regulatory CII family protein [Hafnia paralvei]|uniref:phage regulatory CII family protein n=1 Tax=Hafnia paralvei TaxID=546367 RepID=UPI001419A5CE|nr:phage regulatory CII family protein [Hafnia paralvei]NIH30667.1 hypothetical protein [Hafnia paralvei]